MVVSDCLECSVSNHETATGDSIDGHIAFWCFHAAPSETYEGLTLSLVERIFRMSLRVVLTKCHKSLWPSVWSYLSCSNWWSFQIACSLPPKHDCSIIHHLHKQKWTRARVCRYCFHADLNGPLKICVGVYARTKGYLNILRNA